MYYYITKDNFDGSKEKVKEIYGTIEDALEAFQAVIQSQMFEYRVTNILKNWRIIRLFDENGNQIAQES